MGIFIGILEYNYNIQRKSSINHAKNQEIHFILDTYLLNILRLKYSKSTTYNHFKLQKS